MPSVTFSQRKESNEHKQATVNYYLKNTSFSRSFINSYVSLVSGYRGYERKDTLLANKLIKKISQRNEVAFYRLMQIRLEWEFKHRLLFSILENIIPHLKNNTDSANYSLLLGIYFKDTLIERVARHSGYVKAVNPNVEIVDWKKMSTMKWAYPKIIEMMHNYYNPPFIGKDLRDSSFKYYKKAIELDSTQFYYIKEFLIYLYKFGEDIEIQQLISSKKKNYSKKEKKWLEKLFYISVERKKQMGTAKTWFETL